LQALNQIRQVQPDVIALVSSGFSNDPVMPDPQRFGFQAIVSKPFRIADLSRALEDALSA